MIGILLERLNAVITAFEVYEKPVTPEVLNEATCAVQDLGTVLQQIHVPRDQALWTDSNAVYARMIAIDYARAQADTTRLELAAYAPHARSLARRYLRRRREVLYYLRELVKAAAEAVPSHTEQLKRVRPAYLRVVGGFNQHEGEEERQ